MRHRGNVFWEWADPELHTRTHDETLNDRTYIDVQVSFRVPERLRCLSGFMLPMAWRCMKRLMTHTQENQ
jgi:hypothetical protein